MRKCAVLLFCLTLASCGMLTQQPPAPNVIAATSKTIAAVAIEVGNAQKLGYIDVAREGVLLDKLKKANADLRLAETIRQNCPEPCTATADILISVDRALLEIRAQLPKSKLENAP